MSEATEWYQDWLDTQGYLHNDEDLFNLDHIEDPETCLDCGGSGETTHGWGTVGKGSLQTCKTCNGKGFNER